MRDPIVSYTLHLPPEDDGTFNKNHMCKLYFVRLFCGNSDKIYLLLELMPDIIGDVRQFDLLGELDYHWQHLDVHHTLKCLITLH